MADMADQQVLLRQPGLPRVQVGTAALLASVAALLAFRLPFLIDPALWIDEAFSLYHAKHSFSLIWGVGWRLESSPPLYYTAIWAWTQLFGDAEPVARALSLLFTAVAALCVYSAGASLAGRRAGAVAVILFLCNPLMFAYSLEIRPYALQVLLIAAAVAALARALADLELGLVRSPVSAVLRVAPVIAAAALATYTHSTTPVFLLAMTGAAVAYGMMQREGPPFWIACLLSVLVALLAIAPQLLVMLEVLRTNERGIAWIPSPDLRWVFRVVRSLAVGENSWNMLLTKLAGGLTLGLLAWSGWRMRASARILAVGLVLPTLGFACLWAVSWLQPVLMPRTSLWVIAPLCVLVGCGLASISWQGSRFFLLIGAIITPLIVMSAINIDKRTENRPWARFLTELVRSAHASDEVVAVDKETHCVLDYYRAPEPQLKRWRLELGPGQSYRSYQRIPLGCNQAEEISVAQLSSRLAQGIGLWLLAGDDLQRDDVEAVLKALGESVIVTHQFKLYDKTLAWRLAGQ